jgi:ligand-binding sensor domain-containing protein
MTNKTNPALRTCAGYCGLLSLLFILACTSQNNSTPPSNTAAETPAAPAIAVNQNLPPEDPTFVMPADTISTHGPLSITRNVLLDRKGNIWLATWEGIIRYDGKYFTNLTLQAGLRHFHVFSLLEDGAGNLWFGMIGGGVYRYDGATFRYFTTSDGLASNLVGCIQEDKSGNIWLGTDKGLSRYDGNTFNNFTTHNGQNIGYVYAIVQDKAGILWFGIDGGVLQFDGQSFSNFTNKPGLPPFYRVHSIVEDKNGNILLGSADGLFRYDPSATLHTGEKSLTMLSNTSSSIFEDKAGNLWLSETKVNTPGMVLTRYDGKSFSKVATKTQVFGVAEDKAGHIWFGTANGVCRYDGKAVVDL